MIGRRLQELQPAHVERTFRVNVLAHFWTCKAFMEALLQAPSAAVVTVSSVMSMIGSAGLTDYCASKAAVSSFHESLTMELRMNPRAKRVHTLLVSPYATATGMFDGARL